MKYGVPAALHKAFGGQASDLGKSVAGKELMLEAQELLKFWFLLLLVHACSIHPAPFVNLLLDTDRRVWEVQLLRAVDWISSYCVIRL